MIDPTKNNFTQPLGIQEILDELKLSKDDYDKALSVSKDDNLELHLKTQPNSCFVNNCFNVGLKSWQTNMDIQLVFSEYKAVAYMCQYFSKTEDQFSQAMKKAAKEVYGNNMHHHGTMKTVAKVYLNSRECTVLEAVYHILPELKLKRIFLAVYFVNSNLQEERVQVLLSQKKLSELPDDSSNIFKKSNVDRYVEKPSATFCSHEESSYPKQIKLMISGERMRCHKVRRILRYHVPNKFLHPEKFAHHVLLLFYILRDE